MPDDGAEGSVGRDRAEHQLVETSPDGRYTRFDVILGRGACKTVYKAFDEREGIEVAWNQVIRSEPVRTKDEYDTLLHEINVLKKLKHKNIMTFYDSWVDKQKLTVNFITELFTSGTLRQYRQKHKKISESVLKRWAWQVLQGLVYLHGHDPPIIHRDLKCDNIFVNGSSGVVKIGDLGLATLVRYTTQPQSVLGTPEFMAPELYDGKYDEKADVYAFGMCMLELSTLQYPYHECDNAVQIWKRVSLGILPEGLKNVHDEDLRMFIQLCITHSSAARPEARKLLKHSFFESFRAEKEAESQRDGDSGLSTQLPRETDLRSTVPSISEVSSSSGSDLASNHVPKRPSSSSAGDSAGDSAADSAALGGFSSGQAGLSQDLTSMSLSGQVQSVEAPGEDEDGISVVCKGLDSGMGVAVFELSVKQPGTQRKLYEFDYNLDVDDKQTMIKEMQADLHLPGGMAALVAELISTELDRVKSAVELGTFDADRPESPMRRGFMEREVSEAPPPPPVLATTSNAHDSQPSTPTMSYRSALLRDDHLPDASGSPYVNAGQSPAAPSASPRGGYSAPLPPLAPDDRRGRLSRDSSYHDNLLPQASSVHGSGTTSPMVPSRPTSATGHAPVQHAARDVRALPADAAPVIMPSPASAFESAHGMAFANAGAHRRSASSTAGSGAGGALDGSAHTSASLSWSPVVPAAPGRDSAGPSAATQHDAKLANGPAVSSTNGLLNVPPRPSSSSDLHSQGGGVLQRQPSQTRPLVAVSSVDGQAPLGRQVSTQDGGDGVKSTNRNLSLQDVRARFQQFEETYNKRA